MEGRAADPRNVRLDAGPSIEVGWTRLAGDERRRNNLHQSHRILLTFTDSCRAIRDNNKLRRIDISKTFGSTLNPCDFSSKG
jgi:hypothetical protein